MKQIEERYISPLKNLYKLTQRPKELCDKIFDRLFEEAEIAKFTPQEMREYEASKMAYRDIKNSIDTAKREGKIEANTETAQRLLAMGLSPEQVAKATLLPLKIIENLRNSKKSVPVKAVIVPHAGYYLICVGQNKRLVGIFPASLFRAFFFRVFKLYFL